MRGPAFLVSMVMVASTAFAAAAPAASAADDPFTLYVAPNGSGSNDGLTPSTPVASLEQAEYRLTQHDPDTDVEIRIAQGTYTVERTMWRTYVPGHTISFLPIDYTYNNSLPPGGRPVFQSDATGGYWFWAELPANHPGGDTGLRFYYLEVRGYSRGGLAIVGPTAAVNDRRVPVGAGMNGNVVFGMRFDTNGSLHNAASTGYGGFVAWNSSHNSIRNNHFVRLENAAHEYNLIHGIYLAHGASHNLIEDNAFRYITGHPMNVRNDSNSNLVRENVFQRTGYPAGGYFSDWSCGVECAERYDQPLECPSHGNEFRYNTLESSYEGGWMAAFIRQPGGPDYIGPPGIGCTNDGQVWLQTSGNIRP